MTTLRVSTSAWTRSPVTRTDGAQRVELGLRLTSHSDVCNTSPFTLPSHHLPRSDISRDYHMIELLYSELSGNVNTSISSQ